MTKSLGSGVLCSPSAQKDEGACNCTYLIYLFAGCFELRKLLAYYTVELTIADTVSDINDAIRKLIVLRLVQVQALNHHVLEASNHFNGLFILVLGLLQSDTAWIMEEGLID